MEDTKLLKSIKANPNPTDDHEKFEVLSKSIPLSSSIDDLILTLNSFKNKNYSQIEFKHREKDIQSIHITKIRNSQEIFDYRISRVNNKLLRWLKDGLRRQMIVVNEKISSVQAYKKRMEQSKNNPKDFQGMSVKLRIKEESLNKHQTKADSMSKVMANYQDYSYDELCSLVNDFFKIS